MTMLFVGCREHLARGPGKPALAGGGGNDGFLSKKQENTTMLFFLVFSKSQQGAVKYWFA